MVDEAVKNVMGMSKDGIKAKYIENRRKLIKIIKFSKRTFET